MFNFASSKEFYEYINSLPFLHRDEELSLIRQAQAGNRKARDTITLHTAKMLFKLIKPCPFNARFDENDLFQEGIIAIQKAIQGFDPERGVLFSTYARPKVKKALQIYVYKHHFSIKVPTLLKEIFYKIRKIEEHVPRR